ncbi:MAG: hypothetical protein ABIH38_01385 [Patescibacteria group bacterium]
MSKMLGKVVATTFCPVLNAFGCVSLCCQIERTGRVIIRPYSKEERIPGAETHFFQGDFDHKIISLKAHNLLVTGETNGQISGWFGPIRVTYRGKSRLAFDIQIDDYYQSVRVLKTDLLAHLSWLQAKRRTYLRQAA